MAKITIDDKVIEYSGNPNLIELAKENGIDIPHFCYHPALTISGNCRMCLVEVGTLCKNQQTGEYEKDDKGNIKVNFMPKPQPGCYQQVSDGMVIRTNSERIIEARKGVLEFTLANHPLDCPVCDQAGECVLQDYSFQYGFSRSQFIEKKRTYKKNEISPVLTQEMNRCIHCDRCARFTTEIAGESSFARTWRGNKMELSVLPGGTITHNYQGNMADICPVGALTITDFRFKSRVWFLNYGVTLCTSCGKGCSVMTSHKKGKVFRLKPVYNEKVNTYWMCDHGRLRYRFLNESRKSGHSAGGKKANFQSALSLAAEILKASKNIGVIASAKESLETCMVLSRFFREVAPTAHVDYRVDDAQVRDDRSLRPGELLRAKDPYPNSFGAREAGLLPGQGGATAIDILGAPEKFDAVVLFIDDHIIEAGDRLGNMSKAKNLIVLSPFESSLDSTAAVSFATRAYSETSGTYINIDGIRQKYCPVLPPLGDARDSWDILNQLSGLMGKSFGLDSIGKIRSHFKLGD